MVVKGNGLQFTSRLIKISYLNDLFCIWSVVVFRNLKPTHWDLQILVITIQVTQLFSQKPTMQQSVKVEDVQV